MKKSGKSKKIAANEREDQILQEAINQILKRAQELRHSKKKNKKDNKSNNSVHLGQ